jgi:hypothetical protein
LKNHIGREAFDSDGLGQFRRHRGIKKPLFAGFIYFFPLIALNF